MTESCMRVVDFMSKQVCGIVSFAKMAFGKLNVLFLNIH
jgi:hypothetical protein